MTESQAEFICSISKNIKEVESMIKSLKEINAGIVVFYPHNENRITIESPHFVNYLKEQTIFHYTGLLLDLKAQLDNL
jgi:hypothetical protein